MRRAWFLAVAVAVLGGLGGPGRAAEPAPAPSKPPAESVSPLAALGWLAGSCWTGTFSDGKTKDFICYEWALGGKHLRSRHHVEGGQQPYSGEAFYSYDRKAKTIHYNYFNSDGDVLRGEVVLTADGATFPSEKVTIDGKSSEIRSTWKRKGPDAYAAVTERLFGEEWRLLFAIEFVRDPPATAAAQDPGE